jgi:acetolactate decarboxylase
MRSIHPLLFGVLTVTAYLGCRHQSPPPLATGAATTAADGNTVTLDDALVQYSLIAALADGDYDQGVGLKELLRGGDFGVGTFNHLDGELILLEGKLFQATADGRVRAADLDGTTPFAGVKFFREDGRIEDFAATSLEDLDEQLDRKLPRRNAPYALRIDGEFIALTLRSVPAQQPPFKPLVEVVKLQTTWQEENIRGTLVGVRCPQWVGTLNVAGYHWHFISDDRARGGHVLNCQFAKGVLRYDECTSLVIQIPNSDEFDQFDVKKIKQDAIDVIERQREKKE